MYFYFIVFSSYFFTFFIDKWYENTFLTFWVIFPHNQIISFLFFFYEAQLVKKIQTSLLLLDIQLIIFEFLKEKMVK